MVKIGKREFNIQAVLFDKGHYLSAWNILRYCRRPAAFLWRYLTGKGSYPYQVRIATPTGQIAPQVDSYYDAITVNEIFFRLDYKAGPDDRVVVDIGANIGLSALYFLSRNRESKVYLYEPVKDNIVKLRHNLRDFSDRIIVREEAVYFEGGKKKFGTDRYGRYGGLNRASNKYIEVNCIPINDVLSSVIGQEGIIDILKIDIEGDEIAVVNAIDPKYFGKIKKIYFEIDYTAAIAPHFSVRPEYFKEERRGSIFVMAGKKIADNR